MEFPAGLTELNATTNQLLTDNTTWTTYITQLWSDSSTVTKYVLGRLCFYLFLTFKTTFSTDGNVHTLTHQVPGRLGISRQQLLRG